MTFNQFVKKECGQTWDELQSQGTTEQQRRLFYKDYEQYCNENNITPEWDFKKENKYVIVVAVSAHSRSLVREVRAENIEKAKQKAIKAGFIIRRDPMPKETWQAMFESDFIEHK